MRQTAFQLAFHPNGWWAATRVGLHRVGSHEASWGYTVTNLTPAQAGIGQALLPRLDEINTHRRHQAAILADAVNQSSGLKSIDIDDEADPIFLRFPIIAETNQRREALFTKFWTNGIGAGRLYEETLPSIYSPNNGEAFPGAEAVAHVC